MMNRLNITVRPTDVNNEWEVERGIEYFGIQVKRGDKTDGASIPWYLQWLLKKGGPLFTPSVIHDISYRVGLLTRLACDNIFKEAMIENKVPEWKIKLIYSGVRLFGSSRYNRG